MATKFVYFFGDGKAEGNAGLRDTLGGKGANIAEMTNLKIPVPPGFTISTETCRYFMTSNQIYPEGLREEVDQHLSRVENIMGSKFGDGENPLLLSVRSGARLSMPGMMDTVLNLGLNDTTVQSMIEHTANPRFVLDSYRRFMQMYGNVVMGIESELFEEQLEALKKNTGVDKDHELGPDELKSLIGAYKKLVEGAKGVPFPQDPREQLWGAIGAVFSSWNGNRAVAYRRIHGIPDDWGTAANVQAMVFGNMGDDSATGVAFTRDPGTGEIRFFGEYLQNAQGEDVVAGIRTPVPINAEDDPEQSSLSLESKMPDIYQELVDIYKTLEKHYRDMQDIEFTIQKGKLWMLQTRNGKRTGRAAIRIAVDMVEEGLIDTRAGPAGTASPSDDRSRHQSQTAGEGASRIAGSGKRPRGVQRGGYACQGRQG
jgi:pyruvate,orthophosphate dikinase